MPVSTVRSCITVAANGVNCVFGSFVAMATRRRSIVPVAGARPQKGGRTEAVSKQERRWYWYAALFAAGLFSAFSPLPLQADAPLFLISR